MGSDAGERTADGHSLTYRVTDHKGRLSASGVPAGELPHFVEAPEVDIVTELRVRLEPQSRVAAVAAADNRVDNYYLFLDEERGDISLLVRRPGGGYDLVVSDTR